MSGPCHHQLGAVCTFRFWLEKAAWNKVFKTLKGFLCNIFASVNWHLVPRSEMCNGWWCQTRWKWDKDKVWPQSIFEHMSFLSDRGLDRWLRNCMSSLYFYKPWAILRPIYHGIYWEIPIFKTGNISIRNKAYPLQFAICQSVTEPVPWRAIYQYHSSRSIFQF